jgi:hypothetical protein
MAMASARRTVLVAGIIVGSVVAACVGDDPVPSSTGAGSDAGGTSSGGDASGSSGGDSSAPQAPTHPAAAVAIAGDSNHVCSLVTGDVTISRAADESDVTEYVVYWGSDATTKIGNPIGVLPKTGSNLVYPLANAVRPANATHILVFTKNGDAEMATGVAVAFDEVGQFVAQDISAGQGNNSGVNPSVAIDSANGKLLVATMNGANSNKPALFRCNLDGTSCAYTDISALQGASSGLAPTALVDATNNKLLVVTQNGGNPKPALFRCNLDGTSCSYVDISASQLADSGQELSATIDVASAKLLVAARNAQSGGGNTPGLFRCDLDGANCTFTNLSTGTGHTANSGLSPSVVVDTVNSKLLVVTKDTNNNSKPALFRCNLDGTSCSYTDISAGQGSSSGLGPKALVDTVNKKLLVFTNNGANSEKLALFRCELDGTSCSYFDISAGQTGTVFSDARPAATIDAAGKKLVVASLHTVDVANDLRPGLFRCNLDGTSCTFSDISPRTTSTEVQVAAAWNPASQTLLTVLNGNANSQKPTFVGVCGH